MHKITQVRLKNFQSHEDTTISFDDYNIIYGKTNSGKSAILRGIKWALYNLPPAEGVDFRRFGTKETIVEVTFDDGKKIRRRRTSKENEYILDWALNNFNVKLVPIDIEIKDSIPAFNEGLDKSINKAIRILPSKNMEGFFVAKFVKS